MEKTTKRVTLIKVALSLLLLVAVLAGQLVSQLIGSGLLAAGIPADLCNLTAAVCYALIVLAGLWLLIAASPLRAFMLCGWWWPLRCRALSASR